MEKSRDNQPQSSCPRPSQAYVRGVVCVFVDLISRLLAFFQHHTRIEQGEVR